MKSDLEKKINLIKELNTDDSRFIVNVYESYQKKQKNLSNMIKLSSIILKSDSPTSSHNIIDLDKIWSKPYFYTKMRIHLDNIIEQIVNTPTSEILHNSSKFLKQIIFDIPSKEFIKPENEIDIVEFIQNLASNQAQNRNMNFIFIAETLDEETVFKEEHIKKALEIINTTPKEKQYKMVYDEVYSYLKKDFVSNNYCDFQNNKCVAQRHFTLYPFNRKNGCCFTRIRTCPHLQKGGSCNV